MLPTIANSTPMTPRSVAFEPETPRPLQSLPAQDRRTLSESYLQQVIPGIEDFSPSVRAHLAKRVAAQIKYLGKEIFQQIKLSLQPGVLENKNITLPGPIYLDSFGANIFELFFKQKFGINLDSKQNQNTSTSQRYHFFEPSLSHLELSEISFEARWGANNRYLYTKAYTSTFQEKMPSIASTEWEARQHELGTDSVFRVEGKEIHVHSLKLQIHAPCFYEMHKDLLVQSKQTAITISTHEHKTFELFLEFIYLGKLDKTIPLSMLDTIKLLKLAKEYQVERLVDWCSKIIDKQITVSSILEKHYSNLLNLALDHDIQWLLDICLTEAENNPAYLAKLIKLKTEKSLPAIIKAVINLNLPKLKDSLLMEMARVK